MINHTSTNINEAQQRATSHSQQIQRNCWLDVQERDRINENSINCEFTDRNQVQQDAANFGRNFGTNQEILRRDATSNVTRQEARQNNSR